MSNHKNHHYVPQCYLRQFSQRADYVWVTDLVQRKRYESNVKNVGSERYFNRLRDGISCQHRVENMHAAAENELASLLKEINSFNKLEISNIDLGIILSFVTRLTVSHPNRREEYLRSRAAPLIEMARNSKTLDEFMYRLDSQGFNCEESFSETAFDMLRSQQELEFRAEPDALVLQEIKEFESTFSEYKKRTWNIIGLRHSEEFITGDDPLHLWPTTTEKFIEGSATINDPDTVIFLALGPSTLLVGEFGVPTVFERHWDEKQVAEINRILMVRQKKIFSRSRHFRLMSANNQIANSDMLFS